MLFNMEKEEEGANELDAPRITRWCTVDVCIRCEISTRGTRNIQ